MRGAAGGYEPDEVEAESVTFTAPCPGCGEACRWRSARFGQESFTRPMCRRPGCRE